MATASERIPILVTKADKARFAKKARTFGLSISEFARATMDRFDPAAEEEEKALDGLFEQVKRGSAEAERALDDALAFCAQSNARLAKLDDWMRKKGYA
jgi:hypothetical protein